MTIPPEEMARLGSAELVPGMPVEAYLETHERSVMSFLLKPMTDQLARAFRDD
jgi:HlyD family secretion protein